jgi:hypothetical protein
MRLELVWWWEMRRKVMMRGKQKIEEKERMKKIVEKK